MSSPQDTEEWVSVRQAAELLFVTDRTILDRIHQRKIKGAVHCGSRGKWQIPRAEVDPKYLSMVRAQPPVPTAQANTVIEAAPLVYHDGRAVLQVVNLGISRAILTATGKVLEGKEAGESYRMYWRDTQAPARAIIDGGGTAWLVVGTIGYQGFKEMGIASHQKDGVNAVFPDNLTLARWELSGPTGFGVHTTVVRRKILPKDEYIGLAGSDTPPNFERVVEEWAFEARCVLEITLTASPPLAGPFKRSYRLSVEPPEGRVFYPPEALRLKFENYKDVPK